MLWKAVTNPKSGRESKPIFWINACSSGANGLPAFAAKGLALLGCVLLWGSVAMSAAPGRVELPQGGESRALSSCCNLEPCLREPTEQVQDGWGKRLTVGQLVHLLQGPPLLW